MISPRPLPLLLASTLLPACAPTGGTPSLAPRAIEYQLSGRPLPPCLAGTPTPAPSAAAPTAQDPRLGPELDRLLGAARAGQSEFAAALPAAQRSASRAGASGSEAWIAAQLALSRLEAARGRTVDTLTEIEALLLARSNAADANAQDLQRLEAAAAEVRSLAEAQEAEIDRISSALSGSSALRNAPSQAPHNGQRLLAARQAPAPSGREHISQAARPIAGPTGSACRG